MRNTIFGLVLLSSFSFASAATCVSLTVNVTRGTESQNVKLLQTFLVEKGYLKATPNGYFGPATLAAVKLYQKSAGLPQTGAVLGMTRAALTKESCSTSNIQSTASVPVNTQTQTQKPVDPTALPVPQKVLPAKAKLTSIDKVTFFAGGTTDWSATLYGTGFSTSSNAIYFKNQGTGKKYLVGTAVSSDGVTLVIPKNITALELSCGDYCKEALQVGSYEVSVAHEGGESNTVFASVKSFAISAVTGTPSVSIPIKATNRLLASVTFAGGAPFKVVSVTPTMTTQGIDAGRIGSQVIKDQLTGETFSSNTSTASEYQSKIYGVYGNIDATGPGSLTTYFTVTVMDYIGNKQTTFTSPSVLTSISGE
jgi:peptidoglycan hydrolase-like protein with peptidoglycan-binding domain